MGSADIETGAYRIHVKIGIGKILSHQIYNLLHHGIVRYRYSLLIRCGKELLPVPLPDSSGSVKMVPDFDGQFGHVKRLTDIVICPAVETRDGALPVSPGCEHYYRDMTCLLILPDPAAELITIRHWHHHVSDDQVRDVLDR